MLNSKFQASNNRQIQMTKITKNKEKYIFAVGRRRSAIARVRLFKGKGESVVNQKPLVEYFPGVIAETLLKSPFLVTKTEGKYWVSVKVRGGGKEGQLDAVVHGISRALAATDPDNFKNVLRKEGLLTRDPRIRERRKVGMGGKARRKKQSPKR